MGGDDAEALKKDVEDLQEAVFAATTKIYQKAQAEAEAAKAEGGEAAAEEDNVVDADYEVKDDEKKD